MKKIQKIISLFILVFTFLFINKTVKGNVDDGISKRVNSIRKKINENNNPKAANFKFFDNKNDFIAQWYNWGNWGNWGNWNNWNDWAKWNNWGNWYNWYNY